MLLPKITPRPAPESTRRDTDARMRLAAELRECWKKEQADWDDQVSGDDAPGADLWGSMPVVDSKTVARMAPIFEKHEGRAFDVRRIRAGGYAGINEVIRHLVFEEMKGSSDPAERSSQEVDA